MSDGTTASHVSPIEESEMAKVREIFSRALDAIIAATTLSRVVNELQAKVAGISQEIDDLRQRNATLDEALANTRRQRDDAVGELSQVKAQLRAETEEHNKTLQEVEQTGERIAQLTASLATATRDRDDYMLRHMESEEALAKANDKLAKLHDVLGIKPEAVQPTPTPIVDPTPQLEPALPNPWPPSQAANY